MHLMMKQLNLTSRYNIVYAGSPKVNLPKLFFKWFPSIKSGQKALEDFEIFSTTKFVTYNSHSHGKLSILFLSIDINLVSLAYPKDH